MKTTPIEIAFACPACGDAVEGRLTPGLSDLSCPHCQVVTGLPEADELLASTPLAPCPVCGSLDLYAQRDFNRRIGLAIVVVGSALGPFTNWISVGVAVLLDFALYLCVPTVAVCYACRAQFRGAPKTRQPAAFDIAVHDAYKFSKRFPPRRKMAVAGPLQMRLQYKGQRP